MQCLMCHCMDTGVACTETPQTSKRMLQHTEDTHFCASVHSYLLPSVLYCCTQIRSLAAFV